MFTNSAVCSCILLELYNPNNMAVGIAAEAGMLETVFTLIAVNARTQKRKNARETNKQNKQTKVRLNIANQS